MKTILISFVIATVCFTAHAGKNRWQYVITGNDTLICKNIRLGYVNTRCILLSGEKKKISNKDINVICKSNVKGIMVFLMERKPVYLNNKFTGKNALMELIDVQKGVKIYKYEYFNSYTESMDLVVSFYKGDRLITTQTNPNILQVYKFIDQYTNGNQEFLTSKQSRPF
jgi:hypothetical protein